VRIKTLAILVPLLFGGVLPASAAPLDTGRVAAAAKWVAHIDFDAVKTATLAEKIQSKWLDNDLVKQRLLGVKALTGIDLTKDLHGTTFYGSRLAADTGVVIVHAHVDAKRLLDIIRPKPDYKATSYRGHILHTWTERKGAPGEHQVTGCLSDPELLIVARETAEVKAALDVLDGKSPALAASDSPLAGEVPKGAVVMAAVTDLANAELPFKSPIINQSELFWAVLGERDGEVFGQLKFVAKSEEMAAQVEDILRGLRAMALLQQGPNEETRKAIQKLRVTTSQRTVQVEWRGSADEVWRLIEQELKKR